MKEIEPPVVNGIKDLASQTLGAKHNQFVEYFEKKLPVSQASRKKNLETLKNKLNKLESKESNDKTRLQIFQLQKNIRKLESQLDKPEESEYYFDTFDSIKEYHKADNYTNKENIYKNYLHTLDSTFTKRVRKENESYMCKECDIEMYVDQFDGKIVCTECALTENIILRDNKQSYSDGVTPQESNYFAYKKITHFIECLEQVQGKQRTEIPQEVFDKLKIKMKEECIPSINHVTKDIMKQMLKDIGCTKYLEHHIYIMKQFGYKPPIIPPYTEERLIKMFQLINIAFKKCCPDNRVNFPSYRYTIRKCLQIIGGHDYLLEFFLPPKSPHRLEEIEKLWKNICKILENHGFYFIPSK